MLSPERRVTAVTAMTAMTVRLGCPCSCYCPLKCAKIGGSALRVTAMTAVTVISGYPCCHPSGEHPANAECRRGISSPSLGSFIHPCVRKISPIFPTAFTGCNTLHLAGKERVPDVPSGLPYDGRASPCVSSALRFGYKDGGVAVTAVTATGVSQNKRHYRHERHRNGGMTAQGVSPNCRHHCHRCHPENNYPPKERRMCLCHMQSCVSRNARQAA